jgi:phage/plasmid-associated DNA primase
VGPNNRAKGQALYKSWIDWCDQNNQYKTSQKLFLSALQERPNIKQKHFDYGNYYLGIGLPEQNGYEQ